MISTIKFNVINKLKTNDINHVGIIKNYLENYLETDINIYHPDYIYQLIFNNKINQSSNSEMNQSSNSEINQIFNDEVNQIFNDSISNILIQKRQNIRDLIKKNHFEINSLTQLIDNFSSKVSKLENILCLKQSYISTSIRTILSDAILINYLENLFESLDIETVSDIEKLSNILLKHNMCNYNWFLKLIGSALRNNIAELTVNIPDKYKYFYELNNLIEYTEQITSAYNFLKESILVILDPIHEIVLSKIIICIENCDVIELLKFIDNKSNIIQKLFNNKKQITIAISNSFNKHISNIESFDHNKIIYLLNLIVKCKNLQILENYILLIFDNEKIINSVINIIHDRINYNVDDIKNIIGLLTIKNEDQFMENYHKLLIQRILSNQTNIVNEKIIINELDIAFSLNAGKKSNKVINDYIRSEEDLKKYKEITKINIFDTITTSYANWDINYNQGYITFNSNPDNVTFNANNLVNLKSFIINYQIYYKRIYTNKRSLLWLLQHGEIEITFNNINIILLPIQLLILELYNTKNEFSIDEIYNQIFFVNYSNKFKEDIVKSLIRGNILHCDNNKLYLNEYNINIISPNLIDVYLNVKTDTESSQINTQVELAHDREDIVKTLINHNLKLRSMDKDILFTDLKDNIKLFNLTPNIYNNAIEKMIKYDYITLENNILTKCIH